MQPALKEEETYPLEEWVRLSKAMLMKHQHTCVDCGAPVDDEPERYKGLCFSCSRYEFE